MADTAAQEKEVLKIEVQVEDIGPARKKLHIQVPADQVAAKIEENYSNVNSDAVIPGFRKGRAPRKLIERRFGTAVRDDVRAQLLSEAYNQAIEEQKLDVIGEPDVKDADAIKLPEDGPLAFDVEVEVSPQVELPKFEELTVEKVKYEVTDADVQVEIDRLAQQHGKPAELSADETSKHQDYLLADVHVFAGHDADKCEAHAHEGEEPKEGEKPAGPEVLAHHHDTYVYVTGEKQNFKGHVAGIVVEDLGKQTVGKKAGESVCITMTGPEGHENDKIKGQPITIKLEIKKIERIEEAKQEELPGRLGFESVDAMKEQIRKFLDQRNQRRQQSQMHQAVTDQLAEKVKLDLPEGLTGRQVARALHRQALEMAYVGKQEDEIQQKLAESRSESEDQTRKQLKTFFILDKAAKDLDINVSENELNSRIALMAMQQGRRPEKLRQEMARKGEIEHLYLSIREQKTLDAIVGKAKVTEVVAPAAGSTASESSK